MQWYNYMQNFCFFRDPTLRVFLIIIARFETKQRASHYNCSCVCLLLKTKPPKQMLTNSLLPSEKQDETWLLHTLWILGVKPLKNPCQEIEFELKIFIYTLGWIFRGLSLKQIFSTSTKNSKFEQKATSFRQIFSKFIDVKSHLGIRSKRHQTLNFGVRMKLSSRPHEIKAVIFTVPTSVRVSCGLGKSDEMKSFHHKVPNCLLLGWENLRRWDNSFRQFFRHSRDTNSSTDDYVNDI